LSSPMQALPSTSTMVDWAAQRGEEIQMTSNEARKIFFILTTSLSVLIKYYFASEL